MSKGIVLLCIGIAAVISLAGCASGQKKNGASNENSLSQESTGETAYHKITAEEAKKMMDEEDVIVVDVRRADEYSVKHIPGAVLVPNESIKDEQPEALPDKEAILLVHCRTGIRSKDASDKLVAMGYENVYDFGGINDWTYETETGEYKE
ncbi:MAG: rhodanese-like domain-containing protein [Clostridiaceae bacterium]|nr:rhodanese-like domain-containing protein [Clostridiaceae bacterium]